MLYFNSTNGFIYYLLIRFNPFFTLGAIHRSQRNVELGLCRRINAESNTGYQ